MESPALLSLVWQAEAQGVWSIKGGMRKLARVIEQLAKIRGASFNYGTDIKEFNTKGDRVVSLLILSRKNTKLINLFLMEIHEH